MRLAGGLLLAAVAGFLLGACGGGGGSALSTRVGTTFTQPETLPTRTRTAAARETTVERTTAETTTVEVSTTVPHTTSTRPPLTVTVAPLPATEAATTTAPPPVVSTTPTTTAEATTGSTSTPWGWIALVLALAGVGALVAGVWSRKRSRASSWSSRLADLSRRTLIALDDVLERGSVMTGHVQAFAAEARSLETHAPGERERAAAGQLRASLDELIRELEADRTLRLASPPPTPEQLAYSAALIRQQVEQLQGVLRARA
jgi:hypothetical protein